MDETLSQHEWLNKPDSRILVHDPIHDSYYLPGSIWQIVDKPEYQRLRDIKQTGNTCYVYIGAEHTRFSHCLGVSYLCLEFAKTIQRDHPDLLNDKQVLLLGVAGLIHDIGHCAYSHLYDSHVVPFFDPGTKFTHEQASYEIFCMMYDKYQDIRESFSEDDKRMVGKLIFGCEKSIPLSSGLEWTDWDDIHQFYYEILSNKRLGIDVDKFDYLKRDSHFTGVRTTFDPTRLIGLYYIDKVTRKGGGLKYLLDYQPKAGEIIKVMWQSRDDLHRRVYQHRVVRCIDLMITDVITKCGNQLVPGTETPLSDAHHDMEAYCRLTDSVIRQIAQDVPEANAILSRIDNRKLWSTVATVESRNRLEFSFSDKEIVVAAAILRDVWIYYIYHKGPSPILDTTFYQELIEYSQGSAILLRT
jgi:deoxynucleoside triphosphate triphosphohydrolase SAMHD1